MKYVNAADVLPEYLLRDISKYVKGKLLYIPVLDEKCSWGEKNGTRAYFQERNRNINEKFHQGESIDSLAKSFNLSKESIRKIVGKSNISNKRK